MTNGFQSNVNENLPADGQISGSDAPVADRDGAEAFGQAEAPLVVERPAPGETVTLDPAAGQVVVLNFPAEAAELRVDGYNLVFGFDDDGDGTPDSQIVFLDLVADGGDVVTFQIGSAEIESNVLAVRALALAGERETSLAVAVGPDATSGGVSVHNDDFGDKIGLLKAQDVIGGTGGDKILGDALATGRLFRVGRASSRPCRRLRKILTIPLLSNGRLTSKV